MRLRAPEIPYPHRDPGHRRALRWRRVALLVPVLVALCFTAAACGGGPTPAANVASVGKSTGTTDPPSAGGSGNGSNSDKYAAALKYSECMRSHGVANFPDPSGNGNIEIQASPNSSNGVNPDSAQFKAANRDCRHFLPNGGQPTAAQKAQFEAQALKFSQCMRRHGFPNFPDPEIHGNSMGLKISPSSGIDPRSPQFQAAQKACSSYLPGRVHASGGFHGPSSGSGGHTASVG
ncbi:MAG: hypothetical protein J2P58_03590 [Acidimicrobiaceae bacterium]|nr:hypothetical protein [Acidimicrobiaceae bacterium]MBO0747258.1 hypothetical protein [Acidimicrobiaceae bacterium]